MVVLVRRIGAKGVEGDDDDDDDDGNLLFNNSGWRCRNILQYANEDEECEVFCVVLFQERAKVASLLVDIRLDCIICVCCNRK